MSEIGRNRVLVVKNAGARARSGAIAVASRPIIVHLSGVSSHLSDFLRGVLRTCRVVNRKSLFFVESVFFVDGGERIGERIAGVPDLSTRRRRLVRASSAASYASEWVWTGLSPGACVLGQRGAFCVGVFVGGTAL